MSARTRGLLAVCAIAALGTGCGGDDALPESARNQLAPQVAAIRLAAESFQPDVARQKLAEVRESVDDLHRRGVIDDDERSQLLAVAVEVDARLELAPTTTTTTTTTRPPTTTRPTPTTSTVEPGKDKADPKGKARDERKQD